jgi:Domain of unknown function (DUF4249)
MKRYRHIIITFGLLLGLTILCERCKDPYISPYKSPTTGYLVVEGYISGNTISQFTLTRTIALPGDSTLPTENGATVVIQGSDNSSYPLIDTGNGVYRTPDTLTLNPQLQYRLSIQTSNGEKYLSDLVPFKQTPAIDSINWVSNSDYSIQIYANTHDPNNSTHYYQWNFDQTFEYHSAETSDDYWDTDTVPPNVEIRSPSQQVFRCWESGSSTSILIGSSIKLASDVIYRQPIKSIPPNDIQSSVLYSILVRQYALTADAYNFLQLMQQNTESLGSIFDAQPSQLTGNIHCLTNPTEQVIGWVSAGTVQSQRIFIYRYLIRSTYFYACPIKDTLFAKGYSQWADVFGDGLYTPLYYTMTAAAQGYLGNYTNCLVCTTYGGTNVAPSFWPVQY